MLYIGIIIAAHILLITAYWLWKRYYPQGVLLFSGILMAILAYITGLSGLSPAESTGSDFFDIFKIIGDSFSENLVKGGLMLLSIGGYVSYMKYIGASDALTHVALRPLSLLEKHPYLAATALIPIGQILFICIPSATGLAFLLAGTILPALVNMGLSKKTAVSAIALCTMFDLGPASANSLQAAKLSGLSRLKYFLDYQLDIIIPLSIIMMITFYFTNRKMDKKEKKKSDDELINLNTSSDIFAAGKVHKDYLALLPVLPLLLLVVFSNFTGNLFGSSVEINITIAIFVSLFISMLFRLFDTESLGNMFYSLKFFWVGMGRTFSTIITLIVCAEIFAKGLISLGIIDGFIKLAGNTGMSGVVVIAVMTIGMFITAMLTGSANAPFFSFSPLMPSIAFQMGIHPARLILPMQLCAGIGRTVSPIAAVIIAISDIGGVSPLDIVKRNLIPALVSLAFLII